MAVKKPARRIMPAKEASMTLMGNQDTRGRGNLTARKKDSCITFWAADEQKQKICTYVADRNATVSRLIIEGLEMRKMAPNLRTVRSKGLLFHHMRVQNQYHVLKSRYRLLFLIVQEEDCEPWICFCCRAMLSARQQK